MQQAHRAGKRPLPQAQEQHCSLHPAQVRKLPSCGEPGAIDYLPPGGTRRGGVDAVADGHSELPEPCGEPREGRARVEMSLIPEIQPLSEPSGQVRLEPRDLCRGEALETRDRKSTRLNSSHGYISDAVFCLKKKNTH